MKSELSKVKEELSSVKESSKMDAGDFRKQVKEMKQAMKKAKIEIDWQARPQSSDGNLTNIINSHSADATPPTMIEMGILTNKPSSGSA